MIDIDNIDTKRFLSTKSIGDIYGLPVTARHNHTQPIHHNYLIWIGIDSANQIYVAKYYLEYPMRSGISLERGEGLLAEKGYTRQSSDWPSRSGSSNELNTVDFAGAGRFSIVLGIPGWQFYNFPEPGHEAVVFQRHKSYYDTTAQGTPVKLPFDGTYNRSFVNGEVSSIRIDKKDFAIFRCENIVADENGDPIPANVTKALLFDINVRMPIGQPGQYALVVIDPGGGNLGPPDQP